MKAGIRIAAMLYGGLVFLSYRARGPLNLERLIGCGELTAMIFPVLFLSYLLLRRLTRNSHGNGLDTILFTWPERSAYTIRHLLTGTAIFGSIGQGKTTTSGLHFARAVVGIPNSSGVIFASNPDDPAFWRARFKEAGREGDLIEFSPTGNQRWNILATQQDKGTLEKPRTPADARALTKFFIQIAETVSESKGGENDQFWKMLQERILYNGVEAVRQGRGSVDAPSLARFISGAAFTPAQLGDESWQAAYHNQTLKLAHARPKTTIEAADYQMLKEFWLVEYPSMDQKVKTSAIAGISNVLHALNSGIVREIISTTTTDSADDLARGVWHLWNFPVTEHGASARALYSAVKAAVQGWVLKREFKPGDPVVVLWADEAWHIVNTGDLEFLSESRKHGGTLIYLSQTVNNYAIAMGDGNDRRKSQALLGLISHKVIHACDYDTAHMGSQLVGQSMQYTVNTSPHHKEDDTLNGLIDGQWDYSLNQGVRALLLEREFQTGLAIGQAWVIRTGDPFNSEFGNAIKVNFKRG